MPTYRCDEFEQLASLEAQREESTGTARAALTRRINTLVSQEPYIKEIIAAMETQREKRTELDVTQDIQPTSDIMRQEFLAKLKHSIIFFAYRAFSLPIDYRITNADGEESDTNDVVIESIVIQPELLSDDFLIALGHMTTKDKRLPYGEKLAIKIATIPHIKKTLKDLSPLPLGSKRKTGRISLIQNPKNNNFGKYIVFQETTDVEKNTDTKRRKKVRKIVPHVYDTVYSLIRSQKYAHTRMAEKIDFLKKIKDEIISTMILRWRNPDYSVAMKQSDIATLMQMLHGKLSYNEKRALEDRIGKISYTHNEQDSQRLIGAYNDIIRETEEKIGKDTEIFRQIQWLKNLESAENGSFNTFYQQILRDIKEATIYTQDLHIEDITGDEVLSGIQVSKIKKIWTTVHYYMMSIIRSEGVSLGAPYHTLCGVIASHKINMTESVKKNNGMIDREGLRITLSLILGLKRIRYQIAIGEAEHIIKLGKGRLPPDQKQKLRENIMEVLNSLENIRFLPSVELREAGQEKFEKMIETLDNLQKSLQ